MAKRKLWQMSILAKTRIKAYKPLRFWSKREQIPIIPSKNLRYSIQGSIQISKTIASRSCCERSIPDSYYRQRHRNTARKISLRYELHSYYHQPTSVRPAATQRSRLHLKQQKRRNLRNISHSPQIKPR
jgi:hypothetical protein